MPQHFTVEQANALLPTLEDILKRLQAQRARMAAEYGSLEGLRKASRDNGGHARGAPYLIEVGRFSHLVEEIHSLGCILKDVDQGLVDFPALKEDREIYLCWMLGEASVEWWHEREAGFAGRQPIETL